MRRIRFVVDNSPLTVIIDERFDPLVFHGQVLMRLSGEKRQAYSEEIKGFDFRRLSYVPLMRWLEIVQRYVPLDIFLNFSRVEYCLCGGEVIDGVCDLCVASSRRSEMTPTKRVDMDNFEMALLCFRARQNADVVSHVLPLIERYFSERRLEHTRPALIECLRDLGLKQHIKNDNLIMQMLWGIPPPNIDHLINNLMRDYRKVQSVFPRLKGNRKSSMNAHFLLKRLLERLGFDCQDYFKEIKTESTKEYYNTTWALICKELEWDQPVPI